MKIQKLRLVKKHSKKAGLPPGSLVYIGERETEKIRITLIDYNEQDFQEQEFTDISECFKFKTTPTVSWINIDGLHQTNIIEDIGKNFDLHPLILEDILNTTQRPKFEDAEKYIFVVLKMLHFDEENQTIKPEQVSMVLGRGFVISFQEKVGDVFDFVRNRLRNNKGRIRKMHEDYLLYSLLDSIVDSYFNVLEKLAEKIEILEDELVNNPTEETIYKIHSLKKEMIYLRKSIWPLRELVSGLLRSESELITKSTEIYLRDVYDHTIQVIDTVESFRDMISGMLDTYLSSISNRMNNVMKVLTIIATIFIPLTFVAGVYGMNFEYMPELQWRYGYLGVWIIIAVIALLMLAYFKKKKWL
jgi:magnesium transporter